MKKNFLICGLTGWCMEILFTSIGSLCKSNRKLIGKTSIWMFPIYGMAAIICPVHKLIKNLPAICRGGIYTAGIFTCEYVSGSILKRHNLCPWDYSDAKANVDGLIRWITPPSGWQPDSFLKRSWILRIKPHNDE